MLLPLLRANTELQPCGRPESNRRPPLARRSTRSNRHLHHRLPISVYAHGNRKGTLGNRRYRFSMIPTRGIPCRMPEPRDARALARPIPRHERSKAGFEPAFPRSEVSEYLHHQRSLSRIARQKLPGERSRSDRPDGHRSKDEVSGLFTTWNWKPHGCGKQIQLSRRSG